MRKALLSVLLIVIALFGSADAAIVTVDPNTPTSTAKSAPVDDTDKRLLQKVTFEIGYTRLHYALEQISAKTGVTVRCGANKDNWQVRDLPVVVCAKDIPLGKLLRAIADSAKLDLTAETIETGKGKPEKVYRIWFSARSQAEMDNYIAEQRESSRAQMSHAWDALVANADVPDSSFKPDAALANGFHTSRLVARILKDLGPEAKAKVMAGGRIDVTARTYKKPDTLRDLYRAALLETPGLGSKREPPTDEQLDTATFSIIQQDEEAYGNLWIGVSMAPICSGNMSSGITSTSWSASLGEASQVAWWKTTAAKPPEEEKIARKYPTMPDHTSNDLVPIDLVPGSISKLAILTQKMKLDLPKDRDVTYADVMAALAKASGLTIVSEDFVSHQQTWELAMSLKTYFPDQSGKGSAHVHFSPVTPTQAENISVIDVLNKLGGWSGEFRWFINEKDRLLVGTTASWRYDHKDLMPESLLTYLRDKADGDGIELDDLSKLCRYTLSQYEKWIRKSRDLWFIGNVAHGSSISDIFWHFYDRLPSGDRALARSDAGLPLANYDTQWIADFVKTGVTADKSSSVTTVFFGTNGGIEQYLRSKKEQADQQAALFTDPEVIRGVVLRITTKPAASWTTYKADSMASNTTSLPPGIDRHTYYPVLEGKSKNGQKITVQLDPLYDAFPIYSPKREAELAEKRKKP
jgi:hypothetical protein